MRVLLIAPTAIGYDGRPVKKRRLYLPALTLPMLAAVTPPHIHLTAVMETVEDIPFHQPWDVVGITSMGSGIVRAWHMADAFRAAGAKVVLGGMAASLGDPQLSLRHADSLVIGEAEETWPRVLHDAEAGRLLPIYKMDRRPPIDRLPTPRYEVLNRSKIGLWRPVQATRGCPYSCNFCSVTSFFSGEYRKRPPDQVVEDVKAAKRHGSRYISFIDDNISGDMNYCCELFERLIPGKIIWMSQASLHIAEHAEVLKLAHRSGCRLLSFGIESVNPLSLADLGKAWNGPEHYAEAIRKIRSHGIEVSTEMIIGLDHDDSSVFEKTFQFIMDNRIAVPRIHIITPVPGTPLYDQLDSQGRILTHDFSRYSGGQAVFKAVNFSPPELVESYWNLYKRVFTLRSIIKRILPNTVFFSPFMNAVIWATNVQYRRHIAHRISPGIV